MKSVLITGIGGDIAQGVAKILREQWPSCLIYGADIHDQHSGYLFIDQFFILPPANNPEYIPSLRKIVDDYCIDVFLPLSESELAVLANYLEELGPSRSIYPGASVISVGIDKLATAMALKNFGFPVPWTIPVEDGNPLAYPCILKNRFGSGSRDVFLVGNSMEASYLSERNPEAIFQELLEPANREVTCAVYRTRDGRTSSLLMLRKLTGGYTGWAQVIEDDETSIMCEGIANKLNLQGSMNIQLRLTDSGPRIFEINPRFSSTLLMRHKLGFTDVLWSFMEIDGVTINFPKIPVGDIVVRTYDAVVIKNSQ